MIQTENDLCAWFQGRIGQAEEICLLGHPWVRFACYLAAEFQIRALILPGMGVIWIWKILPLEEEELEGNGVFHAAASFCDFRRSCVTELGDGSRSYPIAPKAVEASYRWNPASGQYELNLDFGFYRFMSDRALPDSTGRPACPFIGPRYQEEPEWRKKDSLRQLDPPDQASLTRSVCRHELYHRGASEIVALEK